MDFKLQDIFFVFPLGAAGYNLLELLWRGYTHWSMALAGGLCFCCIYGIYSFRRLRFLSKCLLCSLAITGVEFAFGCLVNLVLQWNVWDYSYLPLQLFGQICLPYTALWFLLSVPLMPLCRQLKLGIRHLEQMRSF